LRINSKDIIAGQPILKIRKLCRYIGGGTWEKEWLINLITEVVQVDLNTAKEIFDVLKEQGFIEQKKIGKQKLWINTIKGNSLAMASAAKPILRKTAEIKLRDFMDRVKQVNENDYYLFKVRKVILFGSYLGSSDKLGDIDIAIELVPKEQDPDKHIVLTQQRAQEAINQGRSFSTLLDQLFWARNEVRRFLKSRSRSISLHETNDPILKQVEFKVIYEE
jgi:predicted nucleotidyltransferase